MRRTLAAFIEVAPLDVALVSRPDLSIAIGVRAGRMIEMGFLEAGGKATIPPMAIGFLTGEAIPPSAVGGGRKGGGIPGGGTLFSGDTGFCGGMDPIPGGGRVGMLLMVLLLLLLLLL